MDTYNLGADLIDRNAARADSPAIWFAGQTLSYAETGKLVDAAAHALLRAGVQREQRVLMLLPDGPELVAAYLGAMKLGAVAVPCNPLLRTADFAWFIGESRARVVIAAQGLVDKLPPLEPWQRLVVCGGDPAAATSWERFVEAPQQVRAAETRKDEAAFWLWTSGSTGRPKAAVHAHQDWPHCCELYAKPILGISAGDRCFSVSKLFHAYGLGNALIFPFWVGATAVLSGERPTPDLAYRVLGESQATLFYGVPTLYAAMLQNAQATVPASLRLCVSAGEPLPGELFSRWKARFGSEILDGIGSSEVLHIYVSPRAGSAKPGSTGLPVEGYEVRIIDEAGQDVPRGAAGDLIVRGPSTALCYWNRLEQTRAKMRGEWFFTGDKFVQTGDGEYHYVGRSDDMFKVGGEWVSPADVEAALISHPAVLEAAVTARDVGGLLKCIAHVVLVKDRAEDAALGEELRAHVRGRCPGYMVPREVRFLKELPKTATGKIQRFRLREDPA